MYNKEKRLILPLFVFWSLVVSFAFVSLDRYVNQFAEKQKTSYNEVVVCEPIQFKCESEVTKKVTCRKVEISDNGKKHIKSFESLSLVPYSINNPSKYSIGYGHLIKSDDPLWIREKIEKYKITKKDAEKIFAYDINNFINPSINRIFNELKNSGVNVDNLSQGFIDGLGSLIYNCGEEGIKNTEFYRLLKRGKVNQAIAKVETTHVYLRGHQVRRMAEAELMKS